ncbi:aminoacyl-tRNA hydrolase [Natranaerobius trueperi]|uniref:Peptidyl-tRNA hydrolase n=1 Tax=Natranaerobius trueperi TaxID=759412 RepID=A0A226BZB9_9FIRM|nr:aminoacyl-tRNA hydrolase [Natranaerobius trueperi]OWZ83664.1 aminoacyl-tRNA hydrolase [Natranaerobius trueperi]
MKLIVGLGNPGKKYQWNRHNIGFMAVDRLGEDRNVSITKLKFQSFWNEIFLNGEKLIAVKPLTYMNRSGHAVKLWQDYFNIKNEDILVIYDDMDLQLGELKLRPTGGTGGHNGLKSIVENLGDKSFSRLRCGIGRPHSGENPASYVMGNFTKEQYKIVESQLNEAARTVELFVEHGINIAMNQVNSK